MSGGTVLEQPEAERLFARHRGLLHAVAYRVLGSVADAEDVVQDAWLRWSRVDIAGVNDAEGFLVRVVTRLAIDRLRSARVRQIARRAKVAVEARRHRYDTDQATRQRATERFLAAALGGDLKALMEVLAPEVTVVSDGGGITPAPRKTIHGLQRVARALVTFAKRRPEDAHAQVLQINGGPGIVIFLGRTPVLAITLHLVDGVIETVHVVS